MAALLGGTATYGPVEAGVNNEVFNENPDQPGAEQRRFNFFDYAADGQLNGSITINEFKMLGRTLLPSPDAYTIIDRQRASANGFLLAPSTPRNFVALQHLTAQLPLGAQVGGREVPQHLARPVHRGPRREGRHVPPGLHPLRPDHRSHGHHDELEPRQPGRGPDQVHGRRWRRSSPSTTWSMLRRPRPRRPQPHRRTATSPTTTPTASTSSNGAIPTTTPTVIVDDHRRDRDSVLDHLRVVVERPAQQPHHGGVPAARRPRRPAPTSTASARGRSLRRPPPR